MEEGETQAGIAAYFAELKDPRWYSSRRRLPDILMIAICAAVSGADGWEDVELYGEAKQEWPKGIQELPHGITVPPCVSSGVCGSRCRGV